MNRFLGIAALALLFGAVWKAGVLNNNFSAVTGANDWADIAIGRVGADFNVLVIENSPQLPADQFPGFASIKAQAKFKEVPNEKSLSTEIRLGYRIETRVKAPFDVYSGRDGPFRAAYVILYFELSDADGFILQRLEGRPGVVFSGEYETYQGFVETPTPARIAEQIKSVSLSLIRVELP